MTFADLLSGESVFLDANTLVYYFGAHAAWGQPAPNWCNGSRTRISSVSVRPR